ncbi:unnamed protein product [Phytophthora lilii]|uniref:Unnamed protein product n=1 Tax=Phytophthora lilii TaxID=2077276 RepID=A0A9W6X536_9STRA|nr:unnamed protein product [Phytophthora lilii]
MIEKLPSMENLQAIQVVALEGLPRVRVLPNVGPYQETLEMVFVQNTPACCSGFLSEGACNTSFPTCCGPPALDGSAGGHSKEKLPSTCLHLPEEESLLPASTTLSVLDQYISNTSNFCDAGQATCPRVVRSIFGVGVEEDTCAGVLFRKCSSELSGPGICFNEDLGRVKCVHAQATIDMRRAEIAAGCPCSAGEEKWLGCS